MKQNEIMKENFLLSVIGLYLLNLSCPFCDETKISDQPSKLWMVMPTYTIKGLLPHAIKRLLPHAIKP